MLVADDDKVARSSRHPMQIPLVRNIATLTSAIISYLANTFSLCDSLRSSQVGGNKPSSNPTSALPQHDSDNNDNDENKKKAAEQDNPVARMMSLEVRSTRKHVYSRRPPLHFRSDVAAANPGASFARSQAELKLLSTALGVRGPSPPPQAGAPPSAPASPGPSGGRNILASSFAAAAALDGR